MDDKDSKKARKAAKKPVPWSSLTIGNWYQCRFEFTEARTQPATADSNSPLSITPTRIKNKSYRILLIAKQGVEVKTAICLYLTSFGGSGKTPSEPVADKRYLKYVPVNATPVPAQTPFYTNIEVDAKSLHGFLNYVDEQKLPGDGINVQSSQRIINMPESLSLEGERVPISSPSWTLEYLKNLKALWVNHIMWEDSVENMAEACEAVTRAYKPIEVGKKRVWTEDDSEESKDMDEHLDATIALALLKNDAGCKFNRF